MNTSTNAAADDRTRARRRLAGFALALAALFGVGALVGDRFPVDDAPVEMDHGTDDGMDHGASDQTGTEQTGAGVGP